MNVCVAECVYVFVEDAPRSAAAPEARATAVRLALEKLKPGVR